MASLGFWTLALVNLAVILGLVLTGVRQIRRGEVLRHRRSMLTAGALVVGFLLAYVGKVFALGREDLSRWSRFELDTLHFHELCVALMLIAGGLAIACAWRMRASRLVTGRAEDPPPPPRVPRMHRGAGWTAVGSAVLGFLSAAFVLYGMYARL